MLLCISDIWAENQRWVWAPPRHRNIAAERMPWCRMDPWGLEEQTWSPCGWNLGESGMKLNTIEARSCMTLRLSWIWVHWQAYPDLKCSGKPLKDLNKEVTTICGHYIFPWWVESGLCPTLIYHIGNRMNSIFSNQILAHLKSMCFLITFNRVWVCVQINWSFHRW